MPLAYIHNDIFNYVLIGGLAVFGIAHMVWRLYRPVPEADRTVIARTLEARGERLLGLRKAWFGGPRGGGRDEFQVGRPYLVTAAGADGATRRYFMAADDWDFRGDPVIKQRDGLARFVASHPRKGHSLFDETPAEPVAPPAAEGEAGA